jgi:hypothetical protein
MNTYHEGQRVRLTVAFANFLGDAEDPTSVTIKIRTPAGVVSTYTHGVDPELIRDGIGLYWAEIDAETDGIWNYRWAGTGAVKAAVENRFLVTPSRFQ